MLVLKRKRWEKIHIGDDIVIKILHTSDGAVRLGIEAPGHIRVLRAELIDRVRVEETASSSVTNAPLVNAAEKESESESAELVDVADPDPLHPVVWDLATLDQFPQAV